MGAGESPLHKPGPPPPSLPTLSSRAVPEQDHHPHRPGATSDCLPSSFLTTQLHEFTRSRALSALSLLNRIPHSIPTAPVQASPPLSLPLVSCLHVSPFRLIANRQGPDDPTVLLKASGPAPPRHESGHSSHLSTQDPLTPDCVQCFPFNLPSLAGPLLSGDQASASLPFLLKGSLHHL